MARARKNDYLHTLVSFETPTAGEMSVCNLAKRRWIFVKSEWEADVEDELAKTCKAPKLPDRFTMPSATA